MNDTLYQEMMDLGMERILDLSRGPRKNNQPIADRNVLHRKPVCGQPAGNSVQVLPAHPKAVTVLGRRKLLVVERRLWIVLRFHERVQLSLLCFGRL